MSKEIEATAPDGTLLKGVLKKQKCSSTWLIMTEPYTDLLASSCELVRDARELLLKVYSDYQRLHQLEGEIRALYPVYLDRISKLEKDSAWWKHCVYMNCQIMGVSPRTKPNCTKSITPCLTPREQ